MRMLVMMLLLLVTAGWAEADQLPNFLDRAEIENAEFTCLTAKASYAPAEQKHIDVLWAETLKYLEAFSVALTTGTAEGCRHSDEAIYETTDGLARMCVMDQRDMQLMVKHIYQVLHNPDKAKECFGAREDVDWIYSPGGELEANSPVAQWLNRMTFQEFFETKVTNPDVRARGESFTRNFYKMVVGDDITMPPHFPFDVSARALPNLWAAVGWFPMYGEDSERNKRNFIDVRGGYAYGEVFGHWGLLRIDEINGEKVGAEVGMTAQSVDTFYPYHNHAISEMYYTMREPACVNQFKTFAVRESNPLVKTVSENETTRVISFDTGMPNEHRMWSTSANDRDPLVYFHQNTIHAFEVDGDCEAKPEEKALVSVWARSNAHDTRNDYGTTLLCESQARPNTPARRGEVIQCDLTHARW